MNVQVSHHAEQRIKDRIGVSKKIADKVAERALEKGITHSETTGRLRRLIDALYLKDRRANNIRIYAEKIYLFADNTLITVINLPNKYKKILEKVPQNVDKR
jgi:predicted HAD superfamily Cof-like phosphohydrolase